MDARAKARSTGPRPALLTCVALALLLVYYLVEISDAGSAFARNTPPLNLTFNSMLDHLLRARFDIDPRTVGYEGFSRGGLVYAYWGIFPALLRLPLLISDRWLQIDITLWSCWIAVCTAVAIKLYTLRIVRDAVPSLPAWLIRFTAIAFCLSGAQICFLRPLLYQEVCLWAGAFAALFVFATVRGIVREFAFGSDLEIMAFAFGGCLLTRVSVAIGLFAALLAAIFSILIRQHSSRTAIIQAKVLRSLIIAGFFVAMAAYVNFERFGNITTFADYNIYNYNRLFPDRLVRTATYGLFNIARLPFGLVYYFFPVWVIHASDHQLLLGAMRDRLIDSAELPPGTFFLSDPFLLLLAIGGIASLLKARLSTSSGATMAAVAAGLLIPALLMVTAISMCFRYRQDFYPLFEFLAFAGLLACGGRNELPQWASRRLLLLLLCISIIGSHLEMAMYRLGDLGPAQQFLGRGVIRYYADLLV